MCGGAPRVQDRGPETEALRQQESARQREYDAQQAELARQEERRRVAEQRAYEEQQRQAEAAAAEAERQRLAREEAARREQFVGRRNEAVGAARTTAQQSLTSRGLDPTRYMSPLESEISRIAASIPDLDPNPGGYFDPSFVEGVLNREQTGARDRYGRDVRTAFGTGYETSAVPDTLDDILLNSILESQYGEAESTLRRARERGDLTDVGFNAATSELGGLRGQGSSTLTGIGDTVLGRYRDELRGIGDRASRTASEYKLGDPDFSIDPFKSEFETTRGRQTAGLEGDIRSAIGSTQLFDVAPLLQKGAKAQGPTSGDPANDFVFSVLSGKGKKSPLDRGVGSSGVF